MPSVLGPYDGRKARRKRCDACIKRQIKCSGGIPCESCRRTRRSCTVTPKNTGFSIVVVHQASKNKAKFNAEYSHGELNPSPVNLIISSKGKERYTSYFFASFLTDNVFTSKNVPINDDLLAMLQHSPALGDAIEAISALHYRNNNQEFFFESSRNEGKVEALQAYTRSVRCVQSKIGAGTFTDDQSALWVTFFLGLFELMRDSTGSNWLSHFLHGTSTMLRLQRPETLTRQDPQNSQRRSFFLATRIFEISRSFIFSDPSFFSNPEWTTALARLWEGEGAALWHPKEALFDMLPSFSELSIRTIRFCAAAPQLSLHEQLALAKSLANEGFILQALLQQWWLDTSAWEKATQHCAGGSPAQSKSDSETMIGHIYYHATSIYLSGTYDYHPYWTREEAPILARKDINWHVSEILRISNELLERGIAGILLFFPLRVAGARSSDDQSRKFILSLLHIIAARGFLVAEAFISDLSDLWVRIDSHCLVDVAQNIS